MPRYNYYILSGLSYNMGISNDFDITRCMRTYAIANISAMNCA